jgi:hypothetical protein
LCGKGPEVTGLRPIQVKNEALMRDGDDPKLDELERLLNDPDVPMQAARVWELLAEISGEGDPSSYSRPMP